MTGIRLENVSKSYLDEDGELKEVLSGLSLDISDLRLITLVGPNGCGKSTLLNLLAGIISPDAGTVHFRGNSDGSPRVGYVWQDYRASLLPWMDVGENIAFSLRVAGIPYSQRRQAADALLQQFGSELEIRDRIYQLSGGQQQMVSLLRSIIAEPDLLLFDEPFAALDQCRRWSMAFRIEQIWMARKVPAVFVSHDVDEAIMLADRILLMEREGGRINRALDNPLPRPRNAKMLTSPEHVRCREEVIEFLFEQGAIEDRVMTQQAGFSRRGRTS